MSDVMPPPDVREWAALYDLDPANWHHNCHAASLAVVRSGRFPGARIARGTHPAVVGAQHSWVVQGDPYDRTSRVIDPTLWSYDRTVNHVVETLTGGMYRPHGAGDIWRDGYQPPRPEGEIVTLTPTTPLSSSAENFLAMVGPLDRAGWAVIAHQPVGGWPAAEIIAAIDDTESISGLVPIDVLGMLTDRNPGGLYW